MQTEEEDITGPPLSSPGWQPMGAFAPALAAAMEAKYGPDMEEEEERVPPPEEREGNSEEATGEAEAAPPGGVGNSAEAAGSEASPPARAVTLLQGHCAYCESRRQNSSRRATEPLAARTRAPPCSIAALLPRIASRSATLQGGWRRRGRFMVWRSRRVGPKVRVTASVKLLPVPSARILCFINVHQHNKRCREVGFWVFAERRCWPRTMELECFCDL